MPKENLTLDLKYNDRLRFEKITNQLDAFVSNFITEQIKLIRAEDVVALDKSRKFASQYFDEARKYEALLEQVLKLAQLPDSLRAEIAFTIDPPASVETET